MSYKPTHVSDSWNADFNLNLWIKSKVVFVHLRMTGSRKCASKDLKKTNKSYMRTVTVVGFLFCKTLCECPWLTDFQAYFLSEMKICVRNLISPSILYSPLCSFRVKHNANHLFLLFLKEKHKKKIMHDVEGWAVVLFSSKRSLKGKVWKRHLLGQGDCGISTWTLNGLQGVHLS